MPAVEKRKALRRTIRYPANIEIDGQAEPIPCTFCDASREGAQLELSDPASLPDEFTLVLSYDGTARRNCKIMWRSDNQVGIEFKKTAKPDLGPHRKFKARRQASENGDEVDIDALAQR